ncbi:MAG TPA: hypothetical protein VME70_01635 [Mycobacteriales bacterium]|nr:hypothetical protein [Mycobacteriales bacterium]
MAGVLSDHGLARRDERTHDATVVEAVFILIVCGASLAGFVLCEVGISWLFGLHSHVWHDVGAAAFCVAVVIAVGSAARLNLDFCDREGLHEDR